MSKKSAKTKTPSKDTPKGKKVSTQISHEGEIWDKLYRMTRDTFGRDKICRLLEYWLLFLTSILTSSFGVIIPQLDLIRTYMGFIRMAMRFGEPLPLLKSLLNKKQTSAPLDIIRTLVEITLVIFFITDHALFFKGLGYLPMSREMGQEIEKLSCILWLVFCALTIIIDSVEFIALLKNGGKDGQKMDKLVLWFINASDLPIIFFFLGFEAFGPIQAGLIGTLNVSLIIWKI